MKLGIVGLPNVGKSTLFNAITNSRAESANYPFCTIEPNVGVVHVPDERLEYLRGIFSPKKVTPAVIEFVDIAGLVRGASRGEGLGNQFLGSIRATDAIIHVVRCFDDPNVIHVEGDANPSRDIEIIDLELILSDMEMIQRRVEKVRKVAKSDKAFLREADLLEKLLQHLDTGRPVRTFECSPEEMELIRSSELISTKPVIYAANMSEDEFPDRENNAYYKIVREIAARDGAGALPICAKTEHEIAQLPPEDRAAFLSELGIAESGLDRMIRESYALLGLISYLTGGPEEVRAWTVRSGTKAPRAAGKIHTDFERGFIRAEVVSFQDLVDTGSFAAARERGLIRSEGKEYVMQDGDVVTFRFNV